MSFLIHDGTTERELQKRGIGNDYGCLPRKTQIGGLACAPAFASHVPLIPESEWIGRIAEMEAKKLWIGDVWQSDAKADFQSSLRFCWSYSLCEGAMAVRAAMGQPFVQLSAESLAEAVGYSNRGNSLDSAIEYAASNGIATRETVPQHDISPRNWKPEYKTERGKYMPTEWYDLGGRNVWAETVTALLLGFGCYVGYNWWGHAVWLDRLRIGASGQIEVHTPNSHGPGQDVWLAGSRAIPSMGSFVLRSMTLAQ